MHDDSPPPDDHDMPPTDTLDEPPLADADRSFFDDGGFAADGPPVPTAGADAPFFADADWPEPAGRPAAGEGAGPEFAPAFGPEDTGGRPPFREGGRRRDRSGGRAWSGGGAGGGGGGGDGASQASAPEDLLAERAILGCCLNDWEKASPLAMAKVRGADFRDPRHRFVFDAIVTLTMANRPADFLSVHTQLEIEGHHDVVGVPYLIELTEAAGSVLSVEHYAERVSKFATVRRILEANHKVTAEGYKRGVDPDAFVQLVESEINKALQDTVKGEVVAIDTVVRHVYDEVLAARERGGEVLGIPSGFRDLDKLTQGLHGTDLFILAARPAMGKTAFALNLALSVALKQRRGAQHEKDRHSVLIFSLEMGREQLVQRLLSARARIGLSQLRKGELNADDEVELRNAAAELSDLRVFIDDTPGVSPVDVRARARRVAMQNNGLDLVVIDYLQLMKGTGGARQSREQEISEISRSLKGLAKELKCSVLALSQLNRGVESRPNKRPMMSDLRESGAIEQDADLIGFIYRDVVYNKDAPPHLAELILVKQRAGSTGTVPLHFEGRLTKFSNLDDRMDDRYAGM